MRQAEKAGGGRLDGVVLSHSTKKSLSSVVIWLRSATSLVHNERAARNKAQDRTNQIHKTIEYRTNHMYKLSCAGYHIQITVKTSRLSGWCGQNQRKGVMRKLDCAEFEEKTLTIEQQVDE